MTLTIDMPAHLQEKLAARAAREGRELPEYVVEVLQRSVETTEKPAAHPVLRLAERVRASVPSEEWASLPADLAANVDHYLYGHPKEQE